MIEFAGSSQEPDLEGAKPETPATPVGEAVARAREAEAASKTPSSAAKRGRGRPKGSKTRHGTKAPPAEPEPEEPVDRIPTEAELRGVGMAWAVIWKILGASITASSGFELRPLDPAQQLELATASQPVIAKYAPTYAKYAAEINLGFVLAGTIALTLQRRAPVEPPAVDAPPAEPAGGEGPSVK